MKAAETRGKKCCAEPHLHHRLDERRKESPVLELSRVILRLAGRRLISIKSSLLALYHVALHIHSIYAFTGMARISCKGW